MFYSQTQEESEINYLQPQKQQKLEKLELNNDNEKDNSTLNRSNHINKSKTLQDRGLLGKETFSNQCCPCCGDTLLNCIREKQTYLFCRRCWQEMPNINQC
ncbi:hypothetical protein NIES267_39970 [Calothrix parasitica NIES-267]|uniref:Uncharacterized protein n=1 Tax=Calothrix parasitica NIES-267 TaxID=1973488 RepID=A0A1Z4LTM2_9CYAN|nr:hypothetical protein NIES267_39970 [Calothrix parasitica NIES-267]